MFKPFWLIIATASKAGVELLEDEEYHIFKGITELLPLYGCGDFVSEQQELIKNASVIVYYMNSF